MARARNIKPGFFKNEDLAECSPWARLCFAGLWTLADREGRLEDRPKKIKGELFAFDSIEVEPLLQELVKWKFITRYTVESLGIIQINTFGEHQNPHHREPPSNLPPPQSPGLPPNANPPKPEAGGGCKAPEASGEPEASPGLDGQESTLQGGQAVLIPDSGFLIPSSGAKPGSADPGMDGPPSVGTRAGLLCKRIRQEGKFMGVQPSNPELLGLLEAGYSDDEIFDACVDAVSRGIQAFGWVSKAVQSGREKASRIKPAPANAEAKAWDGAE